MQTHLLKADGGRIAIPNKGMKVRKLRPETIYVPLKQIHNGWPGPETAGVIKEKSMVPQQVTASVSFYVYLPGCLHNPYVSHMYLRETCCIWVQ
jgi:hypothetical protein